MRGLRAALAAPALLPAILGGCRSIENTRGIPPLYEVYEDATFVRPFYSIRRLGDERTAAVLWPIFEDKASPARRRTWLIPFFAYSRHPYFEDPKAGWDRDWMIFPFFYAGSDPGEGSYFAFFPIAGRIKTFFGQDRFEFAFFPLYLRTQDRTKESIFFLWPLINTVRGAGRSGWHVLPFYGRYRAQTPEGVPKYDRMAILWPFYISQRNNLDTTNPVTTTFFFPFYGRMDSREFTKTTILWPFVTFEEERDPQVRRARGILAPFSLARGSELAQVDIWPFFGVKSKEESPTIAGLTGRRSVYRQYAIWPIQRYVRFEDARYRQHWFWFLPLFWYSDREVRETEEREEVSWTVWPLLRYEREDRERRWYAIAPLWFRKRTFERHWERFWHIFRYRGDGEGSAWEILWGTLFWRSEPEVAEVSILGGLFSRTRTAERIRYSLFWIPWSVARAPESATGG